MLFRSLEGREAEEVDRDLEAAETVAEVSELVGEVEVEGADNVVGASAVGFGVEDVVDAARVLRVSDALGGREAGRTERTSMREEAIPYRLVATCRHLGRRGSGLGR